MDEGHVHPTKIDRCSLMRGEANYYEGQKLELVPDAGDKYDLLIFGR